MSITATKIAAFVGAASWVPQIVKWIYKWWVKPEITVVADEKAEVGYTSFGPIINIHLGVANRKKDVVIDYIGIKVRHEDGDTHTLSWAGMQESLMEGRDISGVQQSFEREHKPIAVPLADRGYTQLFFRFQEEKFKESFNDIERKALDRLSFLEKSSQNFEEDFRKSEDFHNMKRFFESWFWWKKGEYSLAVEVRAQSSIRLNHKDIKFRLDESDIEELRKNFNVLDSVIDKIIKRRSREVGGEEEEEGEIHWIWVNPKIYSQS